MWIFALVAGYLWMGFALAEYMDDSDSAQLVVVSWPLVLLAIAACSVGKWLRKIR